MKKRVVCFLVGCVMLLCACAAPQSGNDLKVELEQDAQKTEEPIVSEQPSYEFTEVLRERTYTDETDGTVYASYSYSVPMMRLAGADALTQEERDIAERNVAAFNEQMQQILDEAVAFGEELAAEMEGGYFATPVVDEKTMTVYQTGEIISVLSNGYFYGGGAHPNVYTTSYIFDLMLGRFIDPAQLGDDPEYFRTNVTQLLIAQADSLGEEYTSGYWDDYAEVISRWNDTTVVFEAEGMKVIFSVYELGPYAMGPVELFLTYEELADAIGEGGLKQLGVEIMK